MADNSININVNTKADTSEITSLKTVIEDTTVSAEELGDAISSSTENATSSINETTQSSEELNDSLKETDPSPLEDVASSSDNATSSIDESANSTEKLNDNLNNIDGSKFDDLKNKSDEYKQSVDEASDSTITMVDALASMSVANELYAGLMGSVDAAGNYSDTMVRLGYALDGTSMSAEQAQSKFGGLISELTSSTGRGAGAVREHLIKMGNIGITSSDILINSFDGISKAAFQMGTDIDAMDRKFQQVVLTGMANKRSLAAFGLSVEDLAKSMGVSVDEVSDKFKELDQNSRASVLSSALNMKYGADVTENYKNSYEHLTESVNRAKDYLIRSIGEAVLPYVIPAMQSTADIINGVANAFRGLPSPIQGVVGGFGGLVVGATAFSLALSSTIKIAKFAISPFTSLYKYMTVVPDGKELTKFQEHLLRLKNGVNTVKSSMSSLITRMKSLATTAINTAKSLITSLWTSLQSVASAAKTAGLRLLEAGKNALIAGANALKSAAMWMVEKAQKLASAVASGIATAAQWALNIAMSANPIYLVVIAIIALIAVLGYLYFNNETVRNAINGLGQSVLGLATYIWDSLIGALQWLSDSFTNVGNTITSSISGAFSWLQGAFTNTITFFQTYGQLFVEIFFVMATGGIGAIVLLIANMNGMPSTIGAILQSALNRVVSFASALVSRFTSAANNSVNGFMNYMRQLPGKFLAELNKMIQYAIDFASRLPQIIAQAAGNMVLSWTVGSGEHSPGFMYNAFIGELDEMDEKSKNIPLAQNMKRLSQEMVSNFGEPTFKFSNILNNDTSNNFDIIKDILDRLVNSKSEVAPNYVFNLYGDIDNEERMEKFIEAVRRELYWNNETAGRRV